MKTIKITIVSLLSVVIANSAYAQHIPDTEIKCQAYTFSKVGNEVYQNTTSYNGKVSQTDKTSFKVKDTLTVFRGYTEPLIFSLSITLTPDYRAGITARDLSDDFRLIEASGSYKSNGHFYAGTDLKTKEVRIQVICRSNTNF